MYIKVKVLAGAKVEKIIKKSEDHFEIFVKEPGERNLANKKVVEHGGACVCLTPFLLYDNIVATILEHGFKIY